MSVTLEERHPSENTDMLIILMIDFVIMSYTQIYQCCKDKVYRY